MNKKEMIGILIIVSILLITSGLLWFIFNKPIEEDCPGKGCVKVQSTCCPCSMGGKEICVKESEAEEYREKLKSCREDIICPAVYSCEVKSCTEKRKDKT